MIERAVSVSERGNLLCGRVRSNAMKGSHKLAELAFGSLSVFWVSQASA